MNNKQLFLKFKCLNFVNQQFGMSRVCNAFVSFPSHPVLKVSATGRSGKNVRKVNIWRGSRKVQGEKEDQKSVPCGVQQIPFVPSSPAPTRFLNQKQPLTSETGVSGRAVWLYNCLFCLMPSVNPFHKYSGRQMLSFYCSRCVGCINNLKCTLNFTV